MKPQKCFILSLVIFFAALNTNIAAGQSAKSSNPEQTIFVWGTNIDRRFVQYVVELTQKPSPKICYLPTASADNAESIKYWEFICKNLNIEPHVLKVWVSSETDTIAFEDVLLSMDAIVVGGGNTLNMMAIWEAQGIDRIMQKALQKGIILAGGSAGSICWFQNGVSDSRPVNLSIVDGLAFLSYSNCPHYGQNVRRELFHQDILNKGISAGYACDDLAGILFKDGKFAEAVSANEFNNSYYVTANNGEIQVEKLQSKFLISKNALSQDDYTIIDINKSIKDCATEDHNDIINTFVTSLKEISKEDKGDQALKDTQIFNILIYQDSLAAVINKREYDFYCISFFYKHANVWHSAGEDIGNTPLEAEISFRERAKMHMARLNKKYNP